MHNIFIIGWWVGKANNGAAIFGVGFVLWCERSEHDKTNLANFPLSYNSVLKQYILPFPYINYFSDAGKTKRKEATAIEFLEKSKFLYPPIDHIPSA